MYNMIMIEIQLGEHNMRNTRRINNKKKKIIYISISIVIGIAIIGSYSLKSRNLGRNIAEAKSVVDTIGIMKKDNPVNLALYDEIELYEMKKAELKLRAQRKKLEEVKLLEQQEAERLENEKLVEIKASGKIAYLTFDDGPSMVVTPQILDILKEYDVKATFFVIGYMAEKYPQILRRTYDEGHTIGNHSYSHNYGYIYRNSASYLDDLNTANLTLKSILGEGFSTNVVRFPGGSFGKQKVPMVKAVKDAGYKYFDWNSLNGDAEGVNIPMDRLITRFKETVKDKKELIILMHDTDQKTSTVESLGEIIEYLNDEGYIFGVLDEY